MTLQGGKIRIPNRLWSARKRRGLAQKQVAFLIAKTIEEVSRYEKGMRLPELPTMLALEIVYGASLRALYKDLYEQVLAEIRRRIKTRAGVGTINAELLADIEKAEGYYCAYEEMLKLSSTPAIEQGVVRDHVTKLARKLAGL